MTLMYSFALLGSVLLVLVAMRWVTLAVAARSDRETQQLRTYLGWKPAELGN